MISFDDKVIQRTEKRKKYKGNYKYGIMHFPFLGDLRQITPDSDEAKINEGMTTQSRPIPLYPVKYVSALHSFK